MTQPLSSLSTRAAAACAPMTRYANDFGFALGDAHDVDGNEDGFCIFSIAENRQNMAMLADRMQNSGKNTGNGESSISSDHYNKISPDQFCYNDWRGMSSCRSAVAAYTTSVLLPRSPYTLQQQHVHLASGAGAVVHHLAYLLADAGDCVLVPTPSYPAFTNDLMRLASVNAVEAVPSSSSGSNEYDPLQQPEFTKEGLEQTLRQHNKQRQQHNSSNSNSNSTSAALGPIRALIVTNPHNPSGRLYSRQQLELMLDFCIDQKLHFISDEIYAASVWDKNAEFVSVAEIMADRQLQQEQLQQRQQQQQQSSEVATIAGVLSLTAKTTQQSQQPQALALGDYVHIITGLSKDFSVSGWRCGFLFTSNTGISTAWCNCGYFTGVSQYLQDRVTALLLDTAFTAIYLDTNRQLLLRQYTVVTKALAAMNVAFLPAQAALFLLIDLAPWLQCSTFEAEWQLYKRLFAEAKVMLVPGLDCHCQRPGWFRLCFSYASEATALVGMERLRVFLAAIPRQQNQDAASVATLLQPTAALLL